MSLIRNVAAAPDATADRGALEAIRLDRRGLLKLSLGAGSGLVLGALLPTALPIASDPAKAATGSIVNFNPFVRITPEGKLIVVVKHLDKGQGAATGLATLVAEELDAAWEQVETEFAPANAALYKNLFFGMMGTGGSTAMANSWAQYRNAGATARAMLVAAAAESWKVEPSAIKVEAGKLSAGSRTGTFAEFAALAAKQPVPAQVTLKAPEKWVYIGKSFPRVDSVAKTTARGIFTQDLKLPGMKVAAVKRPERFGAKVKSFDAAAALKVRGVLAAHAIPSGVVVIADNTWAAFKGRDAVKVEWDDAATERRGSAEIITEYRKLATTPGKVALSSGEADQALAGAAKVIEAEYSFPYLAHAAMEPLDVAIQFADGRATIWTGAQMPNVDQQVAGSILGIKPENVAVNTLWAGGSFGRRAVPSSDYVAEAAQVAKAWGRTEPVKVVWSREDDMRGGYYRPAVVHRVRAGIDAAGRIVGWHHRIVGQPILIGTPFEMMVKDGIDPTLVGGIVDTHYSLGATRVEVHQVKVGIPVLWWRSVEHTHTAYVMETMLDELARAAGADPVAFRLAHLEKSPRQAAVLRRAAEAAGWGTASPEGVGRGIAVHESFKSLVAQVAEVRMVGGRPKIERVVAAVDCGIAINPDNVRAQVEGGVAFGLSSVLREKVLVEGGVVSTGNFDTYEVLRHDEMPKVEVHIMPSTADPTGIGEPGVPPVGPAVANAIAALTGKRVRDLPIAEGLKA